MFNQKSNFKAQRENLSCPRCKVNKDTTEHVTYCLTKIKIKELRKHDSVEWENIVKGFMECSQEREREEELVPVLTLKATKRYHQLQLAVVITGLIDWWIQGDALDVYIRKYSNIARTPCSLSSLHKFTFPVQKRMLTHQIKV